MINRLLLEVRFELWNSACKTNVVSTTGTLKNKNKCCIYSESCKNLTKNCKILQSNKSLIIGLNINKNMNENLPQNLLSKSQHAYWNGRSTETALHQAVGI